MPEPERYELSVTVRPDDIDDLGHVNNVVYVRWVQEAAIAHWQSRATEEAREGLFWVVARHEIDYLRPAFLEDDIIARTWVGRATRLQFDRHTELVRASDGERLVRARTVWVPVDRETLRPTEVGPEIRERWSVFEGPDGEPG